MGDPNSFQRGVMQEVAHATGGVAYYNDQWPGHRQRGRSWRTTRSFYTLAYTPANLQVDNRWHKVRVRAEGRAAVT